MDSFQDVLSASDSGGRSGGRAVAYALGSSACPQEQTRSPRRRHAQHRVCPHAMKGRDGAHVLACAGKPLNLQMFHRDDEGAPRIPKLPQGEAAPPREKVSSASAAIVLHVMPHFKASQVRPGALWCLASAPGSTVVPRKCAREHLRGTTVLPGALARRHSAPGRTCEALL